MMTEFVIYVGNKPFMNYVMAVLMQFTSQGATEAVIKARGRFISKAVDVAEVVRKKYLSGQVDIKEIRIDSEEFKTEDGKEKRVSVIEIVLAKKQ